MSLLYPYGFALIYMSLILNSYFSWLAKYWGGGGNCDIDDIMALTVFLQYEDNKFDINVKMAVTVSLQYDNHNFDIDMIIIII